MAACYKSRRSFPIYLASEVQERSNAPIPGQRLETTVSKSRAIPPYVPGVNSLGWLLISALACTLGYYLGKNFIWQQGSKL